MRFKHIKLCSIILSCNLLFSNTLSAASSKDHFFFENSLGLMFLYSKHDEKLMKREDKLITNDGIAGGIAFGKRYNNLGAKVGYMKMMSQKYNNVNTNSIVRYNIENFLFDLNTYHEIADNLEARSTVGVGMLHSSSNQVHQSNAEIRLKAGVGLQYNFTKQVGASYELALQGGNKDYRTYLGNVLTFRYNFV